MNGNNFILQNTEEESRVVGGEFEGVDDEDSRTQISSWLQDAIGPFNDQVLLLKSNASDLA